MPILRLWANQGRLQEHLLVHNQVDLEETNMLMWKKRHAKRELSGPKVPIAHLLLVSHSFHASNESCTCRLLPRVTGSSVPTVDRLQKWETRTKSWRRCSPESREWLICFFSKLQTSKLTCKSTFSCQTHFCGELTAQHVNSQVGLQTLNRHIISRKCPKNPERTLCYLKRLCSVPGPSRRLDRSASQG